jgi:hypothetical protein
VKAFIVFLALLAAVWFAVIRETPAHWRGMPAAAEPQQTAKELPKPFLNGIYTVTPLARYSVRAVVLSRSRYRLDDGAEFAPLDLALGWGSMSIADVINDLSISQSGRWYEYSWHGDPPLDPQVIATHSANTHCLPANALVKKQLLAVNRHDLVTLEGYLVEISNPNGYHWRSSLSRDDTGGGACEVLWVTSVTRKKL